MDSLPIAGDAASRALFYFEGPTALPADLELPANLAAIPTGMLTLSGPSEQLDAAHWPVRGDLAHVRLAGRCFVPHYAVPMPHLVTAPGAAMRSHAQAGAAVLADLAAGESFDVLDMSGGWCWGQVAPNGLVGYILHQMLIAVVA